ncbi:MAG: hypothetical protein LBQ52_10320 [Helicobacteraceae bacterium]|jgi:predicted transposase/invertase (TIGR01784 family)|nr:hypothetical protein [Helicobacteraceae bacterium]
MKIAKANEKMIKLTNDPEVLRAYDMRVLAKRNEIDRMQLAKERGIAIGEKRGEKRGRMVEKETIAKNLKGFGVSFEQIAKAGALSIEEIEALK